MSTRRSSAKGKQPAVDSSSSSSQPTSLVLSRRKKSYLIALPLDYPAALAEALELFPRLDPKRIFLERELPAVSWVRLTKSGWAAGGATRDGVENVVIRVGEDEPSSEECDSEDEEERAGPARKRVRREHAGVRDGTRRMLEGLPEENGTAATKETLRIDEQLAGLGRKQRIVAQFWDGRPNIGLIVRRMTPMRRVYIALAKSLDIPLESFRLSYEGYKVISADTLASLDVDHDDCVDMQVTVDLAGGKPVIYLFPPGKTGESSVSWHVSADPQGRLVDLDSDNKTELSYLFWEAHSTGASPSPASTLPSSNHSFNPSSPSLNASNGSALPLSLFLPYLDKTLSLLALHTSARNESITYWLPSFTRHLSRSAHRVPLPPSSGVRAFRSPQVEPKPDVATRIFLLFRGVDEKEACTWKKLDEVDWVLEWGGMEVVA
ncbi:hypothetical protein JCM8547_000128 [Rhodosporidiobolus lusitaniae]